MVLVLIIVSMVSFIIIELPPGDYLTRLRAQLEQEQALTEEQIRGQLAFINERYGISDPFHIRYWRWISGILQGDLGYSFAYGRDIATLIGSRFFLTIVISSFTVVFTFVVAVPIGVYSAVRQYSMGDYIATVIGFVGLATPNFLLALILQFVSVFVFGAVSVGGLFSPRYITAAWSWAKIVDLLKHMWLPVVIIGTAGTAGMIRVVRGQMLNILGEPYIATALMKGVSRRRVVVKHALRSALNPVVSSLGMSLPRIISGATVTGIVLNLPTTGPLLIGSLLQEDMYLACTILMMLTGALVVGNFLADLVLAWLDPRIRYG
jgi:peptide/nickel transport system permease protein